MKGIYAAFEKNNTVRALVPKQIKNNLLVVLMIFLCSSPLIAEEFTPSKEFQPYVPQQGDSEHLSDYTENPKETAYSNYQTLEQAKKDRGFSDEAAQIIDESARTRPYFVLDPANDPLFKESEAIIADSEKILTQKLYTKAKNPLYTEHTCEEAKPLKVEQCHTQLMEPVVHYTPAKYSHWWCKAGIHEPDDPSCRAKAHHNPPKLWKPEKIEVINENWQGDCGVLEQKTTTRQCRLVKKICTASNETREAVVINLENQMTTTRSISRPCWAYEHQYECGYLEGNRTACDAFRKQGCEQLESECVKYEGSEDQKTCILWNQRYRCQEGVREAEEVIEEGDPIHMPNVDTQLDYKANEDGDEAFTYLAMLKELQDDLRASEHPNNVRQTIPEIFKGKERQCSKGYRNIRGCCEIGNEKGDGWGKGIGGSCKPEEAELSQLRARSLCQEVGGYCTNNKKDPLGA